MLRSVFPGSLPVHFRRSEWTNAGGERCKAPQGERGSTASSRVSIYLFPLSSVCVILFKLDCYPLEQYTEKFRKRQIRNKMREIAFPVEVQCERLIMEDFS